MTNNVILTAPLQYNFSNIDKDGADMSSNDKTTSKDKYIIIHNFKNSDPDTIEKLVNQKLANVINFRERVA